MRCDVAVMAVTVKGLLLMNFEGKPSSIYQKGSLIEELCAISRSGMSAQLKLPIHSGKFLFESEHQHALSSKMFRGCRRETVRFL